jgi:hypothetical protein
MTTISIRQRRIWHQKRLLQLKSRAAKLSTAKVIPFFSALHACFAARALPLSHVLCAVT